MIRHILRTPLTHLHACSTAAYRIQTSLHVAQCVALCWFRYRLGINARRGNLTSFESDLAEAKLIWTDGRRSFPSFINMDSSIPYAMSTPGHPI
jgi:hypothetical protein